MDTLIVFTIGAVSALLYSKGKADPVKSARIDVKRAVRWTRDQIKKYQAGTFEK